MVLIPDSFGQFSSLKKAFFFKKLLGILQEALQNPKGEKYNTQWYESQLKFTSTISREITGIHNLE